MSMISTRLGRRPGTDVPSLLSTPMPDGAVRCGVCAHRCLVRPGRVGICGVRENRDGVLVSTAYGAAVAVALDPIEKKPLFHVAPGTLAYSLATAGCPFHCVFCQNWEIAQGPRLGRRVPARSLPPDRAVTEALAQGARSVAYTYVEPTVFLEYALAIARPARAAGLLNLFITDGYATPEAIGLLATVLDAANVDLKGFNEAFYRRRCGARLDHVLEALEAYRRAGVWLEVTTLVIPGENDDPGELRALTAWLVEHLGAETPWHVSRFFPAYRMMDRLPTPLETLRRAAEIGREAGLRHVYVGNAPELAMEDTRCAGCDALLLGRHGYRLVRRLADDGSCPDCGRRLAGRALEVDAAARPVPCG
jgi:pyruvate formate lyase activating enzyme